MILLAWITLLLALGQFGYPEMCSKDDEGPPELPKNGKV
jgi:hypothetical protein